MRQELIRNRRPARGFTLLEVLIALAIVAMSVGALLGTVTSSASNVIYLKDKTLAEWVALNRLTEWRIDQNMPDTGKRTGNTIMGGMKWEWEEEVVELPDAKGAFRVDVRARATGEFVDDTRPAEKPVAQKLTPSTSSGAALEKANWTTTVTGVVSKARSPRQQPVGMPMEGSTQSNNPGNPNAPPGSPGNNPGTPNPPGTPGAPGTGGRITPPGPPPDR